MLTLNAGIQTMSWNNIQKMMMNPHIHFIMDMATNGISITLKMNSSKTVMEVFMSSMSMVLFHTLELMDHTNSLVLRVMSGLLMLMVLKNGPLRMIMITHGVMTQREITGIPIVMETTGILTLMVMSTILLHEQFNAY
jgi:hypothetical protein